MTEERSSVPPRARPLPAPLAAFAAAELGAPLQVADLSWEHGESAVWRLAGSRGRAVLKAHRQGRKFQQELTAYRAWLPLLRPRLRAGSRAPTLLAARHAPPRALLLGFEEGELLERLALSPGGELELHRRAGAFLRALHDLPLPDEDPTPLAAAFEQRLAAWSGRAQGLVAGPLIADVNAMAREALPFLQGLRRVPCHRDFTPRNWLIAPPTAAEPEAGALVVIDFEHSHPDLYLTDIQRLWAQTWPPRPDLRASFMAGYGRQLGADEEEALRRVSALWGLSTVVWARQHGDAAFEESAWRTLRRLGLGEG